MKSKLILVTGGARSGKSSYAESLVTAYSKGREEKAAYLATAQALDQEMTERIRKHSSSRPRGWQTYEEPFWPHKAFQQAAEAGKEAMLLDCLTMLTSNWLCRLAEPGADQLEQQPLWENILPPFTGLLDQIKSRENTVLILVTNEVGWGIVPENAFTRVFRDIAGRVNCLAAQHADEVWLVVAGQPLRIKPGFGDKDALI